MLGGFQGGVIKFCFKCLNCITTNYLCWERVPYIDYSIKKEMFGYFRSEGLANYFESVVSGCSFPIDNKIIAYINVIEAMEHFKDFY